MSATKKNRLAYVFEQFTKDKQLSSRVDNDGQGAELIVPVGGKSIRVTYHFDPSEDSYEFGAALGKVNPSRRKDTALRIMSRGGSRTAPTRGITERIIENKFVILGSRDGLKDLSDASVERRFMDNVARIATYFNQTSQLLGE